MTSRARHLLGLRQLAPDAIEGILQQAAVVRNHLTAGTTLSPPFEGDTVLTMCWSQKEGPGIVGTPYDHQISSSFNAAATYIVGAKTRLVNYPNRTSHWVQEPGGGFCDVLYPDPVESPDDAIRSIEGMLFGQLRTVVVRHTKAGVPKKLSEHELTQRLGFAVINGGDGNNENPTEALVHLHALRRKVSHLEGLRVLLIGDLKYDPLGNSLVAGLASLGAEVHTFTTPEFISEDCLSNSAIMIHQPPTEDVPRADIVFTIPVGIDALTLSSITSSDEYLSAVGTAILDLPARYGDTIFMPCRSRLPDGAADPFLSRRRDLQARTVEPDEKDALAVRVAAFRYCLETAPLVPPELPPDQKSL